ncbi:putative dehydrogenase/threonine dehydrogenase-like Zn-dependent dehydrogenase [Salinibacter ruber]|uniref:bi-domain-containing oxidoreductase n=1 Tax=Salinibacter ruber TaxID=146919 RepID=UPI0021675DF8|nr:bi-domain-containing oxidoreductase [Salinibacter ruber]MCS3634855.1 putative dehydrogenase/threonine dehydrogenase-like Zn-dependent dehydrogenase [Salinibacter ruber]MCS3714670.1 putative dehydrogenase/threonine dehydrogenase-like Zn-dependent dehydrogenase [Salinibacter ruber]
MKQVLQSVNTGNTVLETVPPPALQDGRVSVRTTASLISAGTEKMLIDLAKKSMVGKAAARPDLVKKVLNKVRTEGLWTTFQKVQTKMEKPMPLGYSAAGIVEAVGDEVRGLQVGDRVAMAGAGYANHAEVNVVPKNLVAEIPDGVEVDEAAYGTVGSIALQGVRLAEPQLGEQVAVVGLGLIGLLTVQLLKANGCRVVGTDLDPSKVELAEKLGLDRGVVASEEDPVSAVEAFSAGRGVDHTLITAATDSNQPIEQAGEMTRRKGDVVVVGKVGMDIPRDAYYHKELEVKVSMSYGPGRYDPSYEEGGVDYPYDYVRWTEQRNMEAVLDLMAQGKLDVEALTTHRFPFDEALDAYDLIQSGNEPHVGILLDYDVEQPQEEVVRVQAGGTHVPTDRLGVGFAGAGNYASVHLIPHVQDHARTDLVGLCTATGKSAKQAADSFGFDYCTTDLQPLLDDDAIDAVFIATRHSTHAEFAARALEAGKHVFVEKPMVVTEEQLDALRETYEAVQGERRTGFMVGLNRRFAPMVQELRETLPEGQPTQMIYRVNSGPIDTDSWLHRPEEGGGMLVGEMVHFIDLMQHLCGERPTQVYAQSLTLGRADRADYDNLSITVTFDDGSTGTLCYNTVGDSGASKERLEVYGGGTVGALDDFRRLEVTQNGSTSTSRAWSQDKGQPNQIEATVEAFRERGRGPVPFDELIVGMQVVFAAQESLRDGEPVDIPSYTAEYDPST